MRQTSLFEIEKKYPESPGFKKKSITSKKAADMVRNLGERQQTVYDALRGRPMTDHELAAHLDLDFCQVAPRRCELMAMGKVMDSGITRLTPYKRQGVVWRVIG